MSAATENPPDALAPQRDFPIQLQAFEGPLDLLLFLIRRNEVDIYDIPIGEVTRQYLDILHAMERLDLEVAGDFFVMAAQLMYIKSRTLLPVEELPEEVAEEEDGTDPRWELVQQLLEYKKFKEAAERLREHIHRRQDYLPRRVRAEDQPQEARPLKPIDRIDVWNTFNIVLRRILDRLRGGAIHDEQVTVAERMEAVLKVTTSQRRFNFESLITAENVTVNYVVSTFIAILELARLGKLSIQQDDLFDEIWCETIDNTAGAEIQQIESEFL